MVPTQGNSGNAIASIGFNSFGVDIGEMNTKKQTFDPEWCADTL